MTEPALSSTPIPKESSVAARKPAHVIIVGNEKGGSGKTTTTMHLIVALLRLGFNIGSMDIDARQRSLSRYIENRRQTIAKEGLSLPLPHHIIVQKSPFHMLQEAEADERERFLKGLARIYYTNDFVIIDTPGSDTYLARLAHSFADTVITPINDSFVDLDVLANVDGQTMKIIKPSIYSEMVWEQKLARAKRDGGTVEWIVMRNRLSNIDARNKRHMTSVLSELSRRIGFRVAPGFSERVIFREMFLQGLTVLDVMDKASSISLSHIAARQEVRDLLKILQIPAVDERIAELRAASGDKTEEAALHEPAQAAPVEKTEAATIASLTGVQVANKPVFASTGSTSPVIAVAATTPVVSAPTLSPSAPTTIDAAPVMATAAQAAPADAVLATPVSAVAVPSLGSAPVTPVTPSPALGSATATQVAPAPILGMASTVAPEQQNRPAPKLASQDGPIPAIRTPVLEGAA